MRPLRRIDGLEGFRSVSASEFPDKQRYLTVREAAAYLRVSKSFLDKLRTRIGGPRYVKVGRSVRYDVDSLHTWLTRQERLTTVHEEDGLDN